MHCVYDWVCSIQWVVQWCFPRFLASTQPHFWFGSDVDPSTSEIQNDRCCHLYTWWVQDVKWYCKYNYLSISLITLLNKNNIESHSSIHHHIFHTWPTLAFAPPPFTDEPATSSHLKVPFFKWSGLQDCCSGSGPRGEVGSHQTMFFKGLRALDCRFYKHWPKIKYHRNSGFYNICRGDWIETLILDCLWPVWVLASEIVILWFGMELPADDDGPTIQVKPGSMRMVHQASFESADGVPLETPARKAVRMPDLKFLPIHN